ncbi:hypothetical protein MFIFM68171_09616 [Madurella fahalii]|uniref:Uncharacterized protein n=1 Tax=Madurella fahalii TaxID=1157608 RepID=A0ABQ0GNU4_9PEZI
MASTKTGNAKLSARDLVALDDTEFDQYLANSRSSNGGAIPEIIGLERLLPHQRDIFFQRLKERPGNPDAVAFLTQALTCIVNLVRGDERVYYSELVSDGGRPWYPINLLDEVSENPAKYREMLRYWHSPDQDKPSVFRKQSKEWQRFRQFQKDNRGINDEEAEFAAHVESERRQCERHNDPRGVEFYSQWWKLGGELEDWKYRRDLARGANNKEYENGGFPRYVAAVKNRLARDGYTRDFRLQEDPMRQDTLTTWIEYLSYHIWLDDELEVKTKHLRQVADTAWRELEGSNLLQPNETQEFVLDISNRHQRADETEAALEAVKSAKSEVEAVLKMTQEDGNGAGTPCFTTEERIRMIKEAKSKHEAAEAFYKLLWRRCDRIGNFTWAISNCQEAQERADHHKMMLPWIREQLALIQAESKQARVFGMAVDPARLGRRKQLNGNNVSQNLINKLAAAEYPSIATWLLADIS